MITINQNLDAQARLFRFPQWIITPLPDKKWLLIISGNVEIPPFEGADAWRADTVRILPGFRDPFTFAGFDIDNNTVVFQTEQYATYSTFTSFTDHDADNAGFDVSGFRPFFFDGARGIANGSGIDIDVAVLDADARLFSLAYQLTAVGRIQSTPLPPIQ
jgi:hypothetical protein